jgi:molybdopterin converting factor small subunit
MSDLLPQAGKGARPETIRVVMLGPLRLTLRVEVCALPFPPDGSQEALWSSLLNEFPQLRAMRAAIRLVREDRFLLSGEKLEPGDEVALVPPVSGG